MFTGFAGCAHSVVEVRRIFAMMGTNHHRLPRHPMNLQLIVVSGADTGRIFRLQEGSATLGRGSDVVHQVTDPRASRTHCMVEVDSGEVRIVDSSSGGTFVNGQKIQSELLTPGDDIVVGESTLRFVVGDVEAQSTLTQLGVLEQQKLEPLGDMPDLTGQTVHSYKVISKIAEGRSSVVYKARDEEKNRDLALKVLRPEYTSNDADKQRFLRAMKTMFPVRHENIVRIHNAGQTGDYWWAALEYVDGESMARVIERIGTAGMLDWQYAYRVAVHIGRALEVAFEHNIVHRKIEPENILMRSSDKVVKLGDMMLAKGLEGSQAEQITRPGQLIGEIVYMSPERTRSTSEVDCRSDIYSLGATCYALLTGRPPFEGKTLPELMIKIRNEEPESPKKFQLSVNEMFAGCVLKMLAKNPEDRYPHPTALLTDLERVGKFTGIEV